MRRPDLSDENFRRSLMDFGLDEAYFPEPDPEPQLRPGQFPNLGAGPQPNSGSSFPEPATGSSMQSSYPTLAPWQLPA